MGLTFALLISASVFAQTPQEEIFEAIVTRVVESSTIIEKDGTVHPYQRLEVLATSGSKKGKTFVIEHGDIPQAGLVEYSQADKIMLSSIKTPDGERITITDYVRRTPLYVLAGLFVALTILIGGRRGASAIVGMMITFAVLFLFVLPQLLGGANPFLIVGIASGFVIPVTFLLSHGVNRKTLCAIIGTFTALVITAILANIFIQSAHLTGFASEEAGFLDTLKKGTLDIRGLLFAGIIIALLGILEDITVAQSAIVFQLREANKKLAFHELFVRAMNVGRDHIASMANTLILVYAGASLPLLLLFIDSPLPFSTVINNEVIAEEIVRTLVASIGLILAVPITTFISSLFASNTLFKTQTQVK